MLETPAIKVNWYNITIRVQEYTFAVMSPKMLPFGESSMEDNIPLKKASSWMVILINTPLSNKYIRAKCNRKHR
jgi:hypothetical protein